MSDKKSSKKKPGEKGKPRGYNGGAGGRPTIFSEELANRICELIATNTIGYEKIAMLYPELPRFTTVRQWINKNIEFSKNYMAARQAQAALRVEQIDDMVPHELKVIVDREGNERYDPSSASLLIAKIQNRKWEASKLLPRVYGDHKQIEALQGQNDTLRDEIRELRASLDEKNKKDY